MKKLSFLFGSLMLVVAVSSCSKDESTGTNELGTATIKGIVYSDSNNESNNPIASSANNTKEFVPANTRLIATINADDLAQDGNGASVEKKVYYANVNASGEYTFTIDAGAKSVHVTIEGVEFYNAYSQWELISGNMVDVTYDRTAWEMAPANFTVINGQNIIHDFVYTYKTLGQVIQ
jgi:hypothetical protein